MVAMPAVVVLIVCRVILGDMDDNSKYTKHIDSEWDLTHGVMHCRRQEVPLYDPAVDGGQNAAGIPVPPAAPQPFTNWQCNQAGIRLGSQFDVDNWNRPWRFWKIGCPVPIVDTVTGEIKDWHIPECPREEGLVECENDSAI